MFMRVVVNGFSQTINIDKLKASLEKSGGTFESMSLDGELIFLNKDSGQRELWQAMPGGSGQSVSVWGDYIPGYEFVRTKY